MKCLFLGVDFCTKNLLQKYLKILKQLPLAPLAPRTKNLSILNQLLLEKESPSDYIGVSDTLLMMKKQKKYEAKFTPSKNVLFRLKIVKNCYF